MQQQGRDSAEPTSQLHTADASSSATYDALHLYCDAKQCKSKCFAQQHMRRGTGLVPFVVEQTVSLLHSWEFCAKLRCVFVFWAWQQGHVHAPHWETRFKTVWSATALSLIFFWQTDKKRCQLSGCWGRSEVGGILLGGPFWPKFRNKSHFWLISKVRPSSGQIAFLAV